MPITFYEVLTRPEEVVSDTPCPPDIEYRYSERRQAALEPTGVLCNCHRLEIEPVRVAAVADFLI